MELTTINQRRMGRWCKIQRKCLGLTQQELAETLRISSNTIQKFESSKNSTIETV